jgi:uncharacterized protein YdeI (YjbR/CyaY-like superfamily)
MDTSDLPEALAAHLAGSPEAQQTWEQLTPQGREALATWVHKAWTAHGERERAQELLGALSGGIEAFQAWDADNQWLPASSSGLFGLW